MGEHVRLERRGEGRRSRSAVKSVGGKSDQMRGKVKTRRGGCEGWMTHWLVAKVKREGKEQRNKWNKRQ